MPCRSAAAALGKWQGKAINQVEFTGKPSENCQSPESDDDKAEEDAETEPESELEPEPEPETETQCSSKHIKCGILNAKLSTTTTTTRIGSPGCCSKLLPADT